MFLSFSHPCFVSVLIIGPSLLEMEFFSKTFTLVSVLLGGFLNQACNTTRFTSDYEITLQTNALIATDEVAFATHL